MKPKQTNFSIKVLQKICLIILTFIYSNIPLSNVFSQQIREWRIVFTPNINYSFHKEFEKFQKFENSEFKFTCIAISDTCSNLLENTNNIDILISLEGEYDSDRWEPLFTPTERVQIHFWPLTRGSVTNCNNMRQLQNEKIKILQNENDLISRSCQTIFEAIDDFYDITVPARINIKDIKYWPPYNQFQNGDKLNTIFLPFINYSPNYSLLKVIKCARRQSIEISDKDILLFFEKLNTILTTGGSWPYNRISSLFFPGVFSKNFAGLSQGQYYPIQTTAKICILIQKKELSHLTTNDIRLLNKDINSICERLQTEINNEITNETQKWKNPELITNSTLENIWDISNKARWAIMFCEEQDEKTRQKKQLRRFIRKFSSDIEDKFGYQQRVRFRELDYLIDLQDFWAINNLVDIYNKVGNYTGAKILAGKIINPDIELTIEIPFDHNSAIQNPEHQTDENLARFLENYALALENLNIDPQFPRFVRREAHHLRKKWKSD